MSFLADTWLVVLRLDEFVFLGAFCEVNRHTKNGYIFICFQTYNCLFTVVDLTMGLSRESLEGSEEQKREKMTNSIDPENMKSQQFNESNKFEGAEIGDLAPSEELMLRVEQIFEEAEELWQWMYSD